MTPQPPRLLVDTSVWNRVASGPEIAAAMRSLLTLGAPLCRCPVVDLEVLHSARGPDEYDEWSETRALAYPSLPLTPAAGERALWVQQQLAHRGLHRAAKLPDLLIAAIAEQAGAAVLHYAADYDHIAGITGQPTEWIVPRGSVS